MKYFLVIICAAAVTLAAVEAYSQGIPHPEVPRLEKEEVRSMLGDPNVIILDVRSDSQWEDSTGKIPGAVHESPRQFGGWASTYPKDKTLVLYCA